MKPLLKERLYVLSALQQEHRSYMHRLERDRTLSNRSYDYLSRTADARYDNLCFWATQVSREGADIMVMNTSMSCHSILRDIRDVVPDAFSSLRGFTEKEEYEADCELEKSMTSDAS